MTTTPTTSQFDLLREKRQELNLPEPVAVATQGRQRLVQGVAIGAALIGLSLGVAVLVLLRALMVSAAVDRLGTVEAEVQLFETQLTAARGKLKGVENANADLVPRFQERCHPFDPSIRGLEDMTNASLQRGC